MKKSSSPSKPYCVVIHGWTNWVLSGFPKLGIFFGMLFLVKSIAFNAFSPLDMTYSGHVTPFPAILTLWDFWVHICSLYHKASYIEASVNDCFCIGTILHIPYVNPYYGHVWFWWNLYDSWFECKNNTIENVIILENFLYLVGWNSHIWVFANVQYTYNLEVWFGLRESRRENLFCIISKQVFYAFFNLL